MLKPKVLVSGGSYKFHMAPLAAELAATDHLAGYVTAGWPTGYQEKIAKTFPKSTAWQRFLDRKESIPTNLLHSLPVSEIVFKLGDIIFGGNSRVAQQYVHKIGFIYYSRRAERLLRKLKPDLYHYRNCYGNSSVSTAKELDITAICDHSIAHPVILNFMEKFSGKWPSQAEIATTAGELTPIERSMLADLDNSGYIIVNSKFVKDTCVYMGHSASKIYIVYLGIDDAFRTALNAARKSDQSKIKAHDILYAGGWQKRKGVDTLARALELLKGDWSLTVAGGVEPNIGDVAVVRRLMARPNVRFLGIVPRYELASLMHRHKIFVFPSYCEGSARVIFEALAAGCYVITTPNAGSIVEDGVHGRLVQADDAHGLAFAIEHALSNPKEVEEIGRRNQSVIELNYLQKDYGKRVMQVYREIFEQRNNA